MTVINNQVQSDTIELQVAVESAASCSPRLTSRQSPPRSNRQFHSKTNHIFAEFEPQHDRPCVQPQPIQLRTPNLVLLLRYDRYSGDDKRVEFNTGPTVTPMQILGAKLDLRNGKPVISWVISPSSRRLSRNLMVCTMWHSRHRR